MLIEGGFAWVPPLAWRLDSAWRKLRDEVPDLQPTPSEYFAEHFWLTTQPMEEPAQPQQFLELLEHAPWLQDRLMFSTDYPHWDFDAPDEALPKSSCPDGFEAKLMAENARQLYKLPHGRASGALTFRSRKKDMPKWVVGTVDEIPPGQRKIVDVGGRVDRRVQRGRRVFRAAEPLPTPGWAVCLGNTLGFLRSAGVGEFIYSRPGEVVRCPWHGWEYDLRTGQSWFDPASVLVRRYEVSVAPGADILESTAPAEALEPGLQKGPYVAETFPVSVEHHVRGRRDRLATRTPFPSQAQDDMTFVGSPWEYTVPRTCACRPSLRRVRLHRFGATTERRVATKFSARSSAGTGLSRARVSGQRRLHGPRQLGHRPRGRLALRVQPLWVLLSANLMALLLQHLSAKLGLATGLTYPQLCRDALPRPLPCSSGSPPKPPPSPPTWPSSSAPPSASTCCCTSRCSRRAPHRARRPRHPGAVSLRLPRRRVRDPRPGRPSSALAYVFEVWLVSPTGWPSPTASFVPTARRRWPAHRHGHARRHGHAPQPVPALGRDPDSRQRSDTRGTSPRRPSRAVRLGDRAQPGLAGQLGDRRHGGRGVLHSTAWRSTRSRPRTRRWRRCSATCAATAFAVALLAAGLSSSATATLAGQIIIEGFLNVKFGLFLRRLITVIPALLVIGAGLDAYWILILSQVALSIQLPFAIVPLVWLTARRPIMGRYVNARATTVVAAAVAAVIIALNVALLAQFAGIG